MSLLLLTIVTPITHSHLILPLIIFPLIFTIQHPLLPLHHLIPLIPILPRLTIIPCPTLPSLIPNPDHDRTTVRSLVHYHLYQTLLIFLPPQAFCMGLQLALLLPAMSATTLCLELLVKVLLESTSLTHSQPNSIVFLSMSHAWLLTNSLSLFFFSSFL